MFAVRTEVLKEMFEIKEWCERLDRCDGVEDMAEVVAAYCRSVGLKVKTVKTG